MEEVNENKLFSFKYETGKNYPEIDKKLLEDTLKIATEDPSQNGWDFVKKKDGVSVFKKKPTDSPITMIRGEADCILATAQELRKFTSGVKNLKNLDVMCDEATCRELSIDSSHSILYSGFRLPWPLNKRDFVWYEHFGDTEKGIGFDLGVSVLHDDFPSVKGFVRGEIQSSGYVFIPNGDGKTSKAVYMVLVDPKGWLPAWVVNLVAADQAMNLMRLRNIFEQKGETLKAKKKKKRQKSKKKKQLQKVEQEEVE